MRTPHNNNNRDALLHMILSVALFALMPFSLYIGNAQASPFLFVAMLHFSAAAISIPFLYRNFPEVIARSDVNMLIKNNLWNPLGKIPAPIIVLASISMLAELMFALSLKHLDAAVATIIYELWPILMIVLTFRLTKDVSRYRELTISTSLLVLLSFGGLILVTMSQYGKINLFHNFDANSAQGVTFALLGAIFAASCPPLTMRWGSEISHKIQNADSHDDSEHFFTIVALVIARIIGALVFFVIGFINGETVNYTSLLVAAIAGVYFSALASISLRKANSLSDNLSINAMSYATPAISLLILFVMNFTVLAEPELLFLGGIAIIAANILINSPAESRMGFKSLAISLWFFGLFVYFHKGIPYNHYYNAGILSATIFTLVLSFRTNRLVRRTQMEEDIFLSLIRKVPLLFSDKQQANDAAQKLLNIDAFNPNKSPRFLISAYQGIKSLLREANPANDSVMAEITAKIDALTHSKQQGANFGELISLFILMAVTICGLLLFVPPHVSGHTLLFTKVAAIMLAATVAFLYCQIIDLHHDRTRSVLEKTANGDYDISFRESNTRAFERNASIFICAIIILAYTWCFWP